VAFIAAFTLSSANAQDDVGRFYIGGSIGETKFGDFGARDDFCDSFGRGIIDCSNKDTGVKFYGGYTPHKNFAVEGGFIDFGEVKATYVLDDNGRLTRVTIKTRANTFFLAGMGKISVHPKATLFGKFGLHRWDWEIDSIPVDGDGAYLEDDGVDLFYGIGGEVAPFSNKKIKLRMEYEMFELENFNDKLFGRELTNDLDTDLEFLSIGVTYTF